MYTVKHIVSVECNVFGVNTDITGIYILNKHIRKDKEISIKIKHRII